MCTNQIMEKFKKTSNKKNKSKLPNIIKGVDDFNEVLEGLALVMEDDLLTNMNYIESVKENIKRPEETNFFCFYC